MKERINNYEKEYRKIYFDLFTIIFLGKRKLFNSIS